MPCQFCEHLQLRIEALEQQNTILRGEYLRCDRDRDLAETRLKYAIQAHVKATDPRARADLVKGGE